MPFHTQSRPVPLQPGDTCWIDGLFSIQWVPDWLPRFAPVIYLRKAPDDSTRTVLRDAGGREFRVAHNVYCGPEEWLIDGKWLHEREPAVHALIRILLAEPTPYWTNKPEVRAAHHARLAHILARNGASA